MSMRDVLNYRILNEHRQRREEYHQGRIGYAKIIGDKDLAKTEELERDHLLNNLDRHINSKRWMENPECLN